MSIAVTVPWRPTSRAAISESSPIPHPSSSTCIPVEIPRAPQKLLGERVQDGSLQGEAPPFVIVVPHDVQRLRRRCGSGNEWFRREHVQVLRLLRGMDHFHAINEWLIRLGWGWLVRYVSRR
jgi:hypothetical protein